MSGGAGCSLGVSQRGPKRHPARAMTTAAANQGHHFATWRGFVFSCASGKTSAAFLIIRRSTCLLPCIAASCSALSQIRLISLGVPCVTCQMYFLALGEKILVAPSATVSLCFIYSFVSACVNGSS